MAFLGQKTSYATYTVAVVQLPSYDHIISDVESTMYSGEKQSVTCSLYALFFS